MPDYTIAFWNLENLFAPEDHPDRPDWIAQRMRADLTGWSEALFTRKLEQLARVIATMKGGAGPDLLGVCEVENRYCLERLAEACRAVLPERRYGIVHADAEEDARGIDTAFLYDQAVFSVDEDAIFSHFVMRRTGTRDILQATFRTANGNDLVALANHWPSRFGGHHTESAGFRATAAETLGYWHERIREVRGTEMPVLAMGDMNDEPSDPSLVRHARATRERDDVENARSARFYNLSWNYLRQDVTASDGRERTLYGTLYWQGDGNTFDQILASPALLKGPGALKVLAETARIEAPSEMVAASKNAGPIRFGLPDGDVGNVNQDGYSDHFPVSVTIREEDDARQVAGEHPEPDVRVL